MTTTGAADARVGVRIEQPTVPAAATGASPPATGGRLRSVDVSRGLVVGLSAVLSHIPDASYGFSRHAEWYGLTLLDFILPGFLALFGTGISLAYRRGVRWRRLARRTVLLILIGLLFNAVIAWDVSLDTWRLTGVLQLFAVVGLVVTLVTRAAKPWSQALLVAGGLLVGVQGLLMAVGNRCAGGLPQPTCAPSSFVDPALFGEAHVYRQMAAGYDPEGLPVMLGASATVLLGYVAGDLLWRRRQQGAVLPLVVLGCALLVLAPVFGAWMPINKRIWTPSYVLVTAAAPILLLALAHLCMERLPARFPAARNVVHAVAWLPEAFGRNSLLVYFGKYLVASVLVNVAVAGITGGDSIADWLYAALAEDLARPALAYAAIMFSGWAVVAAVLHRRQRYLKV